MLLVDLILFIFTKWGLKITLNYGAIYGVLIRIFLKM